MKINSQFDITKYRRYYRQIEPIIAKTKHKTYVTTVLSLLSISLFAWYAIRPTLQTIILLRREISDMTEIDKQMEEKITSLIEAQSTYSNIEHRMALIDQALPRTPKAVILAAQMQIIVNETQASLSALRVASTPLEVTETVSIPDEESDALKKIPISITLTGSFNQMMSFIELLLGHRRLTTINTVFLEPESTSSNKSLQTTAPLLLSLNVISYYMSEK